MTQIARPASDISAGGWTDEGSVDNDGVLATSIDEVTIDNDDSYINCSSSATTFKIKLATIVDPGVDTGHSLRIFLRCDGTGGAERTDWELVQGDPSETSIATLNNLSNRSDNYNDEGRALTTGEVGNITDYSDLYIKATNDNISGTEWARVTQVYLEAPDEPGTFQQSHVRIRTGDVYGLNVNDGWEGVLDADVTIDAEVIFRWRCEVEEIISSAKTATLKFKYKKNAGPWTDLAYYPRSDLAEDHPPIFITDSGQYTDNDATTNVLAGSATAFVAGTGEENNTLNSLTLDNEHTEYEVALLIHTFYDAAGQNVDGDTFQIRMVESDDTVLGGVYVTPIITLNVPARLIGGCMVESPARIGPFCDSNGNLYFVIEASEAEPAGNIFLMIKSDDGGDSWEEMDGSNRPSSLDLESVDVQQVTDTLHSLQQQGSGYDHAVVYHKFRMSDHGTNPDTWELTDQSVDASPGSSDDQGAAIAVRSDGTVVGFYCGHDGTDERIYYKIRSAGGTWGSINNLDDTATTSFQFVVCVVGESDNIHIFYHDQDNYDIYHKMLTSGDSLGAREVVHDNTKTGGAFQWAMTEAVYWDDAGSEKIMVIIHSDADNDIDSYVVTDNGSPEGQKAVSDGPNVAFNQGGSKQPVASLSVDAAAKTTYALWAEVVTYDLWRDEAVNDGGWGADVEELDGKSVDWVRGRVFTHSAGNGGDKVLGYIYDNGSGGGTGYIWYGEYVITEGALRVPRHPAAYFGGPTIF